MNPNNNLANTVKKHIKIKELIESITVCTDRLYSNQKKHKESFTQPLIRHELSFRNKAKHYKIAEFKAIYIQMNR
jgi:hypothetical protein